MPAGSPAGASPPGPQYSRPRSLPCRWSLPLRRSSIAGSPKKVNAIPRLLDKDSAFVAESHAQPSSRHRAAGTRRAAAVTTAFSRGSP
eukprot:11029036-Heterocapsa_arctica.AAC.1